MIQQLPREDLLRKRLIFLWRHRLSDVRASHEIEQVLRVSGDEQFAREAFAEYRRVLAVQREREAVMTAQIRSSLRGVSRLLRRMCDHEGLSLGAVAYGVIPSAHILAPGEGHPWLPRDGDAARRARARSYHLRSADGWDRRFYRVGAFIRPRTHPSGRWAVRMNGGVLHASMTLSGHRVDYRSAKLAMIDLKLQIPDTVRIALAGKRLVDVVEHPVFEDDGFVIRSAHDAPGGVRILFTSPIEPLTIADVRPDPQTFLQQLGRDGSVAGPAALADVLLRTGNPLFARMAGAELMDKAASGFFAGVEEERMHRINLMAPPWAERLRLG